MLTHQIRVDNRAGSYSPYDRHVELFLDSHNGFRADLRVLNGPLDRSVSGPVTDVPECPGVPSDEVQLNRANVTPSGTHGADVG